MAGPFIQVLKNETIIQEKKIRNGKKNKTKKKTDVSECGSAVGIRFLFPHLRNIKLFEYARGLEREEKTVRGSIKLRGSDRKV